MISHPPIPTTEEISEWVHREAIARGFGPAFGATFMYVTDDGYSRFAIRTDADHMTAFEMARALSEIRQKWNSEHPDAKISLLPLAG